MKRVCLLTLGILTTVAAFAADTKTETTLFHALVSRDINSLTITPSDGTIIVTMDYSLRGDGLPRPRRGEITVALTDAQRGQLNGWIAANILPAANAQLGF